MEYAIPQALVETFRMSQILAKVFLLDQLSWRRFGQLVVGHLVVSETSRMFLLVLLKGRIKKLFFVERNKLVR